VGSWGCEGSDDFIRRLRRWRRLGPPAAGTANGVILRCAQDDKAGQETRSCPTIAPRLAWSVHLARRQPHRTTWLLAMVAFAVTTAGIGFGSIVLGLLAGVLLVASVAEYLFPVHYTMDGSGVSARGLWQRRSMKWSQVRRVIRDEMGVKLSPLPRPSRLEAYRGIYAWFSENNQDEVMAAITYLTSPEAAGGGDRPLVEFIARSPRA